MYMSWSLSSDVHPRQPLIMEADGRTLRFRSNRLIKQLFDQHPDRAKLLQDTTNSWDDRCQLGQLAGLEWRLLASLQLDPFHGQRPQFFNLSPDQRHSRPARPPTNLLHLLERPQPLQPVLWDKNEMEYFLGNASVQQLIQEKGITLAVPQEDPLLQHDVDQVIQLLGIHLCSPPKELSKHCVKRAEHWFAAKQKRIDLGQEAYHAQQRERVLNRTLPVAASAPPKPRF